MSIVNKLYLSQKYHYGDEYAPAFVTYESPLVELVKRIESALEDKGLGIWRWETNDTMGGLHKTIHYAVGPIGKRPWSYKAANKAGIITYETIGAEGKTPRCDAYRTLVELAHDNGIEV